MLLVPFPALSPEWASIILRASQRGTAAAMDTVVVLALAKAGGQMTSTRNCVQTDLWPLDGPPAGRVPLTASPGHAPATCPGALMR